MRDDDEIIRVQHTALLALSQWARFTSEGRYDATDLARLVREAIAAGSQRTKVTMV